MPTGVGSAGATALTGASPPMRPRQQREVSPLPGRLRPQALAAPEVYRPGRFPPTQLGPLPSSRLTQWRRRSGLWLPADPASGSAADPASCSAFASSGWISRRVFRDLDSTYFFLSLPCCQSRQSPRLCDVCAGIAVSNCLLRGTDVVTFGICNLGGAIAPVFVCFARLSRHDPGEQRLGTEGACGYTLPA